MVKDCPLLPDTIRMASMRTVTPTMDGKRRMLRIPFLAVFLLAVFTRRCNAIGALVGLLTGAAVTMAVAFGTDINFLLYAAIGSLTCFVVGYLVSLMTGGQDRDLAGLTLATVRDDRNGDE